MTHFPVSSGQAVDPAAWDAFAAAHPDGHPLQLSGWAGLKERFGWRSRRVALAGDSGKIAAGAQILLRSTYGLTLAYVPRGPLVDWHDAAQTQALLDALRSESRRLGAAVLKIEPGLPDTAANRALLHGYGFTPSRQIIQPPSTVLVDLAPDEEAILGAMKSKWRYNVRLAARKDVTVRELARAELPIFHRLMHETGDRDAFAVHSDAYYDAAYDLLVPDHAAFLLAEYQGEPLAAIVVAVAGPTAVYLWGASSDRERNRMPNHALQWAGIQWARARGAHWYDLWGIPDDLGKLATAMNGDSRGVPSDDLPVQLDALPGHGLWGVYRFKQGFGGRVVRYVGAWDMPVDPVGARVYALGLEAQQLKASLKSQPQRHEGHQAAQSGTGHLSMADPFVPLRALGDFVVGRTKDEAPATAYRLRSIDDPGAWQAALAELPNPHVLQSWEWGEVKGQTEWHAERLVMESAAGRAAFQFLWRQPLPYLPARIAYVPKGPLLDWAKLDLLDQALAAVEAHARARGCIFVKIDPDVREDTTTGRLLLHALHRRGWRYSAEQIQFKNTATTDLRAGEEALLAGMKSKWRYNVRLAEKRGITVRAGGAADLPAFYALYAETGARDGFLVRPEAYYRTTWQRFLDAQADDANPAGGALLLAEHPDEDQPLAGLFLLRYAATTWYFYGASSDRRRRDMPNYLLQWAAMQWALAQGCTTYDWWGAPTDLADAGDGMQGVWHFKQGFGAEFQPHIGAWDYVISPVAYRALTESLPYILAGMRRLR